MFSSRTKTEESEVAVMHTVPASGVDAAAGRTVDEVRAEETPEDLQDETTRTRFDDPGERAEEERAREDRVGDDRSAMPAVGTADRTLDDPTLDERITSEPRRGRRLGTKPTPDAVQAHRVGFVHTSLAASSSLFLGTAALAAAFSGTLAPVGVLLGGLAAILGGIGLVMVGRDRVTGHGLAVAGLLLGLGAVSVAALVMAGDLSWLHSNTDGAGRAREWLNNHFSWMRNW